MKVYEIRAHWDGEAGVWWAESDDVPGLVAEAKTTEELRAELRQLVPELLILNDTMPDERPLRMRIIMDETEDLVVA